MPSKKATPEKPREETKWQQWTSAPEAGIDELCDMIEAGNTLTAIAQDVGIHVANLSRWIAADPQRSARAREARIAAASSYDDQALAAIRNASDQFALAKAKEEAHHLRWKASKADPRKYGDKLDVTQETTIRTLPDDALDAEIRRLAEKAGISIP